MKILSSLKNIKLNVNEKNVELIINESNNIKYNLTNTSNNEVLSDLIEHKAFATTFLFLNENYELDLDKDSFINESNIIDFYKDCEELLNENVKVVTEQGPLLTSIKGYPIYEVENGILRGSGEKKIFESFEEIKESNLAPEDILKQLCNFLQSNNITKPEEEKDKVESYLEDNHLGMKTEVPNKIFKVMSFNKDDNAGGYVGEVSVATNGTWRYHVDDTFLNEEGTQCSDIAPKLDQNLGINKPKIVSTKINGLKENLALRGFLRNDKGQYIRGNFILCEENNKFIAINLKYLNKLGGN